jgi:uncharacterized damage-inducible protein DinB
MTTKEITPELSKKYQEFTSYIKNLSDKDFLYAPAENKWTIGQHLQHLIMSVSPLVKALSLPTFALGLLFGKANRKSKSYEDLVAKYKLKLQNGGIAPARFAPALPQANQKTDLNKKLVKLVEKLCRQISGLSEAQLDKYILPHPLLGKITLREMFYFTIYHAQHHLAITQNNLNLSRAKKA